MLDDAGFPRGANDKRFAVTLDYPADDMTRRLAEYLRAAFSRLGIDLTARGQDLGSITKHVYTGRDFEMQSASLSPLFDPQVGVQRTYWSKNFINGVSYSNATHYANSDVDALLGGAAIEANQRKRVEMWRKIQELVMPVWETIHTKRTYGIADTASGFEGTFASAYISA